MKDTSMQPTPVDCTYGAPKGRRTILPVDLDEPVKLQLVRLRLVGDGAYDTGGAYWGAGDPLYFARGDTSEVVVEMYTRAKSRAAAKQKIRVVLPNATFFR